jgi:hypothetical protein
MPYRDVLSLDLESAVACTGEKGSYVGRLYYVDRQRRELHVSQKMLKFGGYDPDLGDTKVFLTRARQLEGEKGGAPIPLEACVALASLRICQKQRHDEALKVSDKSGHRVERFRSIAVVRDIRETEQLRPLNSNELMEARDNYGVTHVRRHSTYVPLPLTTVLLPLTAEEDKKYDGVPLHAVQAAGTTTTIGPQPHIILHSERGRLLEELVTLDELL